VVALSRSAAASVRFRVLARAAEGAGEELASGVVDFD
jgi:hypothetical protein